MITEATGHICHARRVCVRMLVAVVAVSTLLATAPANASAAGDASLQGLMPTNALPGWTELPDAFLERLASDERRAIGTVAGPITVATDGWRYRAQSVVVVLVSWPNGAPDGLVPGEAIGSFCTTALDSVPTAMRTFAEIPDSSEARCSGMVGSVPLTATVMSWVNNDVFALVVGNRVGPTALEAFAVKQNAALGATASSAPIGDTSDSSSNVWEVFVIVGIAIALGTIVFLFVARSRSRMPAPIPALGGQSVYTPPVPLSAEPGWQSVNGDPARIAYWDGVRFTAWKRWDGANWVESAL